jgi:hypothetical protein
MAYQEILILFFPKVIMIYNKSVKHKIFMWHYEKKNL